MKKMLMACALVLIFGTGTVHAEYIGPNGIATNVKQLQEIGRDHDHVQLQGYITQRSNLDDDLFEFSDGTSNILIKVSHKKWPAGLRVDHKTRIEIMGEFDRELIGFNKIDVDHLRLAH